MKELVEGAHRVNVDAVALEHFTEMCSGSEAGCMYIHIFYCVGTGWLGVQWFRGGLVFEAHRLLYHSAQGSRTF